MTNQPLISIITVTFNAETTLPHTLASIKSQKGCQAGSDYECVLMDGLSTDSTLEIAKSAGIESMNIISERDYGIYDAMNKAIDTAKGRYLIFLNAGDAFHSDCTLNLIISQIKTNDFPSIVYGQTNLVDSQRNYIAPRHLTAPKDITYTDFARGMLICHQAFIVEASIAPYYDLEWKLSADYEWCIKCLQNSQRNLLIDEVLIDYLSEGMTTRNRKQSLQERFKIMCRYYGVIPTLLRHIGFIGRFFRQRKIESNAKKSDV